MLPTTPMSRRDPDARGYFGEFGGRFVPETLVEPVEELERAYLTDRDDPDFQSELARLTVHYVRRPAPNPGTPRLPQAPACATIYLKPEYLHPP